MAVASTYKRGMAKILVIDDEVTIVQMVTEALRSDGHEVLPFTSGNAAFDALDEHHPDLLITDLHLGRDGKQGLDLLRKARALSPPAVVMVVTAFGSVETAVEAMKQGAYDYVEKPFKLEAFRHSVQRALSYNHAVAENHYLKRQLREKYQFSRIVGTSPQMQAVFKWIERVAPTDSTVLILGESGTGKELVARALHFNSARQYAPFIPVNCAALPENLLESELFGHRRGAFAGALADKRGLFQEAEGGTIFLDEVGSMPDAVQSRLLRVLQDHEVRRVGDSAPGHVNVRVVAATHESLEQKIKEGKFREDLFYRLNVLPIQLPSLRERREDIPLLIANFLRNKISPRSGQPFRITRRAVETLGAYDWPGNVRELENILERACTLCEDDFIRMADFPKAIQEVAPASARLQPGGRDETTFLIPEDPADGTPYPLTPGQQAKSQPAAAGSSVPFKIEPLKDFLREQEHNYLNRVLAHTAGNKEKAAELLDISLATLYRKLSGETTT